MAASDFYATLTAAGIAHHSAGRHFWDMDETLVDTEPYWIECAT